MKGHHLYSGMLSNHIIIEEFVSQLNFDLIFGVLTPLSAIFQLHVYHGDQLRVECTLFCNLQSRARTHAVLVMGLYELLGNPTT